MSKMKTTVVDYITFTDDEFKAPSTFYIKDCLGMFHFIHTRDRHKAQCWVNETFGENKYIVRASKLVQPKGEPTAFGRINSKSKAGSRCVKG